MLVIAIELLAVITRRTLIRASLLLVRRGACRKAHRLVRHRRRAPIQKRVGVVGVIEEVIGRSVMMLHHHLLIVLLVRIKKMILLMVDCSCGIVDPVIRHHRLHALI